MLVGDAAYPPGLSCLPHIKETAADSTRDQRTLNSSVYVHVMPNERAFGALKVRWRSLMGRVHADYAAEFRTLSDVA